LLLGSKGRPNLGSEPAKNFMTWHDTAGTPVTRGACPNMAPLLIHCWYASTGSSVVSGLSGRSFFSDAAFPDTESPCSREFAVVSGIRRGRSPLVEKPLSEGIAMLPGVRRERSPLVEKPLSEGIARLLSMHRTSSRLSCTCKRASSES
jgi:hypothetical protein